MSITTTTTSGPKPAAADRTGFGTLYYNPHDTADALKVVAASKVALGPKAASFLHLEEVRDRKAPVLFVRSGSGQTLQDSFAIAWLIATSAEVNNNKSHHYHSRPLTMSLRTRSSILQWHFFCESELKPFISGLLVKSAKSSGHESATRDAKFADKLRKERLIKSLDVLNFALRQQGTAASKNRFLVGGKLSLADVCVATALLPLLLAFRQKNNNQHLNQLSKEVWGRKDLTYLKAWLFSGVLASKAFVASAKHFPDLQELLKEGQQQHQGQQHHDLNANFIKHNNDSNNNKALKANNGNNRKQQNNQAVIMKELPPLPSSEEPFRVLCLHGYRQNGSSFKEKLGAFRSITGKYIDFTFITAPNRVLPLGPEDINQDQRGWWFSRDSDYFKAQDATDCDKGFEQSLATIVEAFELHGPFHGLMGFSQGAALVALLCLLKARQPDFFSEKVSFQFAIMVSAFRSRSSRHAEFFDQTNPLFKKVQIPTLHIMGDLDRVIDRSMSEEILAFFEKPSVMRHSGGHFIPANAKQKMGYLGFLSKVYETVKPAGSGCEEAGLTSNEGQQQQKGQDETDQEKDVNNKGGGGDAAEASLTPNNNIGPDDVIKESGKQEAALMINSSSVSGQTTQ